MFWKDIHKICKLYLDVQNNVELHGIRVNSQKWSRVKYDYNYINNYIFVIKDELYNLYNV